MRTQTTVNCSLSVSTAAALQSESVKAAQSEKAELKRRVRDMERRLQQEQQDHRDVTSGTAQRAASINN